MRRAVQRIFVVLLGVGAVGFADEAPKPPAPAPATEQAAEAALAAWKAKDGAALEALARSDEPDPADVVESLRAAGELDAALAYAEARVAAVRTGPEPSVRHAAARRSLAQVLEDRRERLRAHDELVGAAEAYPREASLAAAEAWVHAAGLDLRLGSLRRGLRMLDRARERLRGTDRHDWMGRVQGLEGDIRLRLGEAARALRAYGEARAEYEAAGRPGSATSALHFQGDVYVTLGDFEEAERAYEAARREHAAQMNLGGVAVAYGKIALVKEFRGDHEGALRMLAPVMGLLRVKEYAHQREAFLQLLAFIHLRRDAPGDLTAALSFAERGVRVAEEAGRAPNRFSTGVLAMVHARLGHFEEALALLDVAIVEDPAVIPTFGLVALHSIAAATRLVAGDLVGARDGARIAVARVPGMVRGLAEEDSAIAHQIYFDVHAVGMWAAARLGDVPGVYHFLEAGRAGSLLESLGGREAVLSHAAPEPLQTAEAEARERWRVAEAAHREAARTQELPELRARRAAREEAWEAWEKASARIRSEAKLSSDFVSPEPAPISDVRDALRDGEALVLYGLGKAETRELLGLRDAEALALVVTRKGTRLVSLGPASTIEAACASFRPQDRQEDAGPTSDRLRALLVDALGLGADVRRLLVSPDGPLHYVPFSALLPDREVAFTPSGTAHLRLRDDAAQRGEGILALGNPGSDLPGSEEEAKALGDVVLVGDRATAAGLRLALGLRPRWHAVHLACHGYVDPERPMRSHLALGRVGQEDRNLTAMEVFQLRVPADLVVLSACETGRGRVYLGEGLVGLMRAFMAAGSPRVLCSLWKVDDEATLALMRKFYELWNPEPGTEAMGPAAALRAAQEHVRTYEKEVVDRDATKRAGREVRTRIRPWRHPYYWAAWVVWGVPD